MSFRNDVFGRPGVIAATSGTVNAAELRARGAQTVYWWMKLNRVAGTPAAPTDAATVAAGITEMVDKAIAATECQTPVIVINELNSAGSTTPWTPTNDRYRANVLAGPAGHRRARRAAAAAPLRPAVHRRRRARLVAAGGAGGAHRARGLLPGAAAHAHGRRPGEPDDAPEVPPGPGAAAQGRHPAGSPRSRHRLPLRAGQGRPRRACSRPRRGFGSRSS